MAGPRVTATPGDAQPPRVPDLPPAAARTPPPPGKKGETIVKDLTKKPRDPSEPERGKKIIYRPESDTEAGALKLANERQRAVMGPNGWVCPSKVLERRV